eukprot:symbB.v1.2.023760.t1/scaffold2149.1/size87894/5
MVCPWFLSLFASQIQLGKECRNGDVSSESKAKLRLLEQTLKKPKVFQPVTEEEAAKDKEAKEPASKEEEGKDEDKDGEAEGGEGDAGDEELAGGEAEELQSRGTA